MTANSSIPVSTDSTTYVSDELRDYFQNKFCSGTAPECSVPIHEPCTKSWEAYAATHKAEEAFQLLRKCYPQFNFPVQEGINKTQDYIDAVLKGKSLPVSDRTVSILNKPDSIKFTLHESIVGKVPVLTVADDEDFVKIVQCFLYKNNPTPVPRSMGALLINGVNNWNRIQALKTKWVQTNPSETWNHEFSKNILPNPGLYKDKLIVLSTKPYSAVRADCLELTEAEWASYSLAVRLEHECTHLYTLTYYGCASNNLHDELIADYIGIAKTMGAYRKEWMLTFMGLEEYPNYSKGARLENYVNQANLTPEDFRQLISVIKRAIENIARFDTALGKIRSAHDQSSRIDALCTTNLLDMASSLGSKLLIQKYDTLTLKSIR